MRKRFSILMAIALALVFAGCGKAIEVVVLNDEGRTADYLIVDGTTAIPVVHERYAYPHLEMSRTEFTAQLERQVQKKLGTSFFIGEGGFTNIELASSYVENDHITSIRIDYQQLTTTQESEEVGAVILAAMELLCPDYVDTLTTYTAVFSRFPTKSSYTVICGDLKFTNNRSGESFQITPLDSSEQDRYLTPTAPK